MSCSKKEKVSKAPTLRPYQKRVVKKIMWAKDLLGNDIVCVAQGGGKSLIIADVADRLNGALIICPNKEVLEQNIEKMEHYLDRDEIGVFSASMNEKTVKKITFGTIQSMYKKPELFSDFNLVIVDECDLVSPKKMGSMYQKFFNQAGIKKVLGFTATPYRQDTYVEYPGGWKNYQGKAWQKRLLESVTTTKMINRY